MTINAWLTKAIKKLQAADIPTATLDAEILLADALNKTRTWLHTHPEAELEPLLNAQGRTLRKLNEYIERRKNHEPIAYIRGVQEFFGRNFYVSPDTLTPRPETETMIEMLIEYIDKGDVSVKKPVQIVDIGTGSGCIIITAALEIQKKQQQNNDAGIQYLGLDISEPALTIAKKNAHKYQLDISLHQFDIMTHSISDYTSQQSTLIILANLPYVPENFHINLAATHEPAFAIFGGSDGLDLYRRLFATLPESRQKIYVFTESLPPQHNELRAIAEKFKYTQIYKQNLIHCFTS